MATLLLHRYELLGILNKDGVPVEQMGVLARPQQSGSLKTNGLSPEVGLKATYIKTNKKCPECHVYAVIKRDGCDFCTNCSAIGSCG